MGELKNRLDKTDSYLIAKSLLELWIAEFVIDYATDGNEAVEKWFGVATEV